MKMKPEHYAQIAESIDAILIDNPWKRGDYTAAGYSAERFRWDLFWLVPKRYRAPLYAYLTDAHIDTALRRIVNPVRPTEFEWEYFQYKF